MAPIHIPILAFFLGFFIIAWLGSMMAHPLVRIHPKPEHVIIGATAAIAIYSLYMSIIGMAGGLKWSFGFTIAAFLIIGAWHINYRMRWNGRQHPKMDWGSWLPPDLPTKILLWILLLFQFLMLINALAPYINPDAEISHYLFIRNYLESGRITIFPENAFSYYPQALELSVLTAFSRAGEYGTEGANLCYWFMQLLLMGWLIDFCARRGKTRVGYLLAAAACGLFYWPVIAYSGYVDGGVTLFSLAGIFTYFDWLERRNTPIEEKSAPKKKYLIPFWRWQQAGFTQLVLTGIFLGTACASKYSALPVALLVILHLLWILLAEKAHRKIVLATFIGFIIFFLIPVLPWYGRNLIALGNPFFPFLRDIFGGPELTLADDVNTWATWGIPITFGNYFLYPLKLSWYFRPGESWLKVPYLYMSWLFALAPIAGILLFHRRFARIAALWCFIFFSFAFFMMNLQTRYFLPFTILALWLVVDWLETFASLPVMSDMSTSAAVNPRKKPSWIKWIVLTIVLIPFLMQINVAWGHFKDRTSYLFGGLSRDEFIEEIWPTAQVFDRANDVASEENKVMIFSLRTYHLTAPHVIPTGQDFDPRLTPEQMIDRLRDQGIGYLLLESRLRIGAGILEWCVINGGGSGDIAEFYETEFLDAMSGREISRNLAREILKHRGGIRTQDAAGGWKWKIDVSQFMEPDIAGILRFMAYVKQMENEGYLGSLIEVQDNDPVRMDNWELYEIVGNE